MRMVDVSIRLAVLGAIVATTVGLGGCNAARIGTQQRHYQRELARTYDAQMLTNLARVKYGLSPVHMTYAGTKGAGESTIKASGEVGADGGLGEKIIISSDGSTSENFDNNNNWKIKADWTGKTTLEYTAAIATDPKIHEAYVVAAVALGDRLLVRTPEQFVSRADRTPNPNSLKLERFAPELGLDSVHIQVDLSSDTAEAVARGQTPVAEVFSTLVKATLWDKPKPDPSPFAKYDGLYPLSLRVACFILDDDAPGWLAGVDEREYKVCAVLPSIDMASGVMIPVGLDGKIDKNRPALLFLGQYGPGEANGKIVCRVQTLDDPATKVVSGPYMLKYKPKPAPATPAALPIKLVTETESTTLEAR